MKGQDANHTRPWRAAALAVAALSGALLLVACTSGQAEPVQTPAPTVAVTQAPVQTPAPTATAAPRRTPDAGTPSLKAARTNLVITEGSIQLSAGNYYEAEEIYFFTANQGEESHHLGVARWDGDPAAMPLDPATGLVAADLRIQGGSDHTADFSEVQSGDVETYEVEPIAPGHYVVFCDIPGHYQAGEFAAFQIAAPPAGATP